MTFIPAPIQNARNNPYPAGAGIVFAITLLWNPIISVVLGAVLKVEIPKLDESLKDSLMAISGGVGYMTSRQNNQRSGDQATLADPDAAADAAREKAIARAAKILVAAAPDMVIKERVPGAPPVEIKP